MIAGLSQERITAVGLAGTGAVAAAFVQNSRGIAGLSDNTMDLVLVLAAVMLIAKGDGYMRPFGTGVGAAAVSSLIRRNILTTV